MLRAYARWITGHAVLVLVGCALVTLLAFAQIVDLRNGVPAQTTVSNQAD